MKIKADFVTNSSTTSFILDIRCSGFLPQILPTSKNEAVGAEEYKKIGEETKKFVRELFPDKKFEDFYCGSGYAHITMDADYGDHEDTKTPISIIISNYYDYFGDDERLEPKSIVDIHMEPQLVDHDDPAEIYIISIIKNIVKKSGIKVPFTNFNYCASPHQTGSGGWNGGDPMGKYRTTPELMLNETKCGLIVIKDNSFINYIKSLDSNFGLMEELQKALKIKPNAFHPIHDTKNPFEGDL